MEKKYNAENVIMGGDFNIVPDPWLDRRPQRASHSVYNDTILNFCKTVNVVDYWRVSNPNSIQYTWFNPSGNGQCSRLDYWLISCELCKIVSECKITAAPLTDHCMVTLSLSVLKKPQISPNIWKFNNDLLKNDRFYQQVLALIEEIDKLDMSNLNKWEWFKFKVKQIAIDTGKFLSVRRKQKQRELIGEINSLVVNTQELPENSAKLQSLQSQLDELYSEKANGAYIRSRARWIERGEKSSSYFFGLENKGKTKKKISKLRINEIITDDQKVIQNEILLFYSNLYKSNYNKLIVILYLGL